MSALQQHNIPMPWLFELRNPSSGEQDSTLMQYTGVLEFSAPTQTVRYRTHVKRKFQMFMNIRLDVSPVLENEKPHARRGRSSVDPINGHSSRFI